MSIAAPHECSLNEPRPVLGRQLNAEVLSAFIDRMSEVSGLTRPPR